MARDILEIAQSLMNRRRFEQAIIALEGRQDFYEDNFEYYLLFGTACLYAGDIGAASSNFQRARKIKINNVPLLLGQAAIFLRRGDTARAIQYYMDIFELDPANKVAKEAMEFIKNFGDYNTICKWADTGKLERFYPPLGVNSEKLVVFTLPVAVCLLLVLLVLKFFPYVQHDNNVRADLSTLVLSAEEKKHLQEDDLSSGSFGYILTSSQIADSYEKAGIYFQKYRDNAAQIEINRILNSNASVAIKQKSRLLMTYLEVPSFDSIKDVPAFAQVEKEPLLYLDCWVVWSGRISNVSQSDEYYSCEFLAGYDTMEKIDGIIPLKFSVPPQIDTSKAVKILAKITVEDGKLCLLGRSVYQSIKERLSINEN